MGKNTPRISVVMRSKDADWVIGQALAALYSQSYTDFELLVVDSGSTDRTLEIVRQFPCRLIEIEPSDYYPGKVLNHAIEQSSGDIIVFQNSDAVPLINQTLERLIASFDDEKISAAFCRQIPRPEAKGWVRRDYKTAFPDSAQTPSWLPYSLPMAAMRRTAWRQHKFYTAAWGSEDTEWGHWAQKNNHAIRYVPDALVMHSHNYNFRQLYGRRFIEGEADAYIYQRNASACRMAVEQVKHTVRDCLLSWRDRDLGELVSAPIRNVVSSLAYYQGHRLGRKRINESISDPSIGQQVVLKGYGS